MGARRGAVLTQRMLAFARKQALQLEAVDVAVLVRGMIDFMTRTIGPTSEVRVALPPRLPAVRTDPYQLQAALPNLVVNARDAMTNVGVITVTAATAMVPAGHHDLPAGDYVR